GLIADGSTDEQKKLGVALGIVGARLPHGRRDRTIRRLIKLTPWRARANLLLSLAVSGEEIDIRDVADGIAETLEAAKTQSWILTQSGGYELKSLAVASAVREQPCTSDRRTAQHACVTTRAALLGGDARCACGCPIC